MDNELLKSLERVIDETFFEIEELKKSDSRFSAAEVKLDSKDGEMHPGHEASGSIEKKEAEKAKKHEDEEEMEDEADDEDMEKAEMHKMMHKFHMKKAEAHKEDEKAHKEHMEKAEHHKKKMEEEESSEKHLEKAEHHKKMMEECHKDESKKEKHMMHQKKMKHHMKKAMECHKAEGINEEADPDRKAGHKFDKAEGINEQADPDRKEGHKFDKAEKKLAKSEDVLMKSYVDEKVSGLEDKINKVLTMVKEIADAPVPAKGTTYKAQPLQKSVEVTEELSKAELVNKLLELKKSGTHVDSNDIASAELNGSDLRKIANKYKL